MRQFVVGASDPGLDPQEPLVDEFVKDGALHPVLLTDLVAFDAETAPTLADQPFFAEPLHRTLRRRREGRDGPAVEVAEDAAEALGAAQIVGCDGDDLTLRREALGGEHASFDVLTDDLELRRVDRRFRVHFGEMQHRGAFGLLQEIEDLTGGRLAVLERRGVEQSVVHHRRLADREFRLRRVEGAEPEPVLHDLREHRRRAPPTGRAHPPG